MKKVLHLLALLLLAICIFATSLKAKNESPIVRMWPPDKPALKLTFEKFRPMNTYARQTIFVTEVAVQNLTDKQIPPTSFTVYFMDKKNVRIGDGKLHVSDLGAGQTAKMEFQFASVGIPVGLTLAAGVKTIPLTIVSVPAGAKLKVDGQDSGMTPVAVRLTVGTHQLDLAKEGYAPGSTPVDVTPDELPGGSITVELGGLSRDTVELRDGSVVLGDVVSLSMTQVVVRVEGKEQSYDRNQIKKIMLVEREVTIQPSVTQPVPAQPRP